MIKSYIEVQDTNRAAWFQSKKVNSVQEVAALLHKAAGKVGWVKLYNIEDHGKGLLRRISQQKYDEAVQGIIAGKESAFVSRIDLKEDCVKMHILGISPMHDCTITATTRTLIACYDMAKDDPSGKLNEREFTADMVQYCTWNYHAPHDALQSIRDFVEFEDNTSIQWPWAVSAEEILNAQDKLEAIAKELYCDLEDGYDTDAIFEALDKAFGVNPELGQDPADGSGMAMT